MTRSRCPARPVEIKSMPRSLGQRLKERPHSTHPGLLGTTIARWTGRGRLEDLADSIAEIMKVEKKRAKVSRLGRTILVDGAEPASVSGLLEGLPGVAWVAVGRSSGSIQGLAAELGRLAKHYVKPSGTFAVRAESTTGSKPSDLAGAGTSAVLDAVRGARVSESAARTVFRMAFDGRHGVAAVEVGLGAGGAAMGDRVADCLVSGGMHSSALTWAAMLSGYSVRLVHAKTSEESLLAVARLYSELSRRADPRKIGLTILQGEGTRRILSRWSARAGGPVFAGFHAECHGDYQRIAKNAESPLYLLPEEEFAKLFSMLGLTPLDEREKWRRGGRGAARAASFGG